MTSEQMETDPLPENIISRFWSRVEKTPTCWLWRGGVTNKKRPYGVFSVRNRTTVAHRVAWWIAHGRPVPSALQACHRCDVTLCVRPEHLFLGTQSDNLLDASDKGRIGGRRGGMAVESRCKRGHELNETTRGWNPRANRKGPRAERRIDAAYCRVCQQENNRRRRALIRDRKKEGRP